jgi:3-hydroxyisobutyrate dehydrogenase-like beta-hydroxyacid dehydrogenase
MIKKIGFIGLGTVGKSMAQNLLKGDYDLTVFDNKKEAVEKLTEQGARAAESPLEAAEGKDIVITVLPYEDELKQTLSSEGGFLSGCKPGAILCAMGTHCLDMTQDVAREAKARGIDFLDAPVWGTSEHAAHGLLTVLIGGDKGVVSRCREVLSHVALNIMHVGEIGDGTRMRFVVTLMQSHLMAALAESLVLGERLGFNNDQIMEVLDAGGVVSPMLHKKGRSVARGNFQRNLALKYVYEGLLDAKEAAGVARTNLPGLDAVIDVYKKAMEQGLGEEDFSAVIKVLQK